MAEEPTKKFNIEQLRREIREPLRFLAEKLLADLGENFLSLSVVGSSLTADFHPKRSDINTVLVVERRSHKLLHLLAGYGISMGKRKLRAPLLMTEAYIQQSLDVFGVEFLDFQLNHSVIYGPDPFQGLSISKADVRLQCERQLKASLIQLRQGYIRALAKPKLIGDLLINCIAELLVLMRAMLWLVDCDRPREAEPTLGAAAEQFKFDPQTIASLVQLKQQHARPQSDQVESMFENVYQVVDHLAKHVDQLAN